MAAATSNKVAAPLRCAWTEKDDLMLKDLAFKYKGRKWRHVAEAINYLVAPGEKRKTPKQCRERWHSHLNPAINIGTWSEEEEKQLFGAHKSVGNKWSIISENLPGRTDNAVKNYFFCRLRKLARNVRNGTVDIGINPTRVSVEQIAYLLDHLYKFYISPERRENMQKTVYPRIMGRKNEGDKYIIDTVEKDGDSVERFEKYVKGFLAALPCELSEYVSQLYPQFPSHSPSDTDDSFSKAHASLPKLPLIQCVMASTSCMRSPQRKPCSIRRAVGLNQGARIAPIRRRTF